MVDRNPFLSALKISWLKRILHDDGRLSKILQATCPLLENVKQRDGEFANISMQSLKKNLKKIGFDVFKHDNNKNDCTCNFFFFFSFFLSSGMSTL